MTDKYTVAEIEAQLNEALNRWCLLTRDSNHVRDQLSVIEREIAAMQDWRGCGTIPNLRRDLQEAQAREKRAMCRAVRVKYFDWRLEPFLRVTAQRVYIQAAAREGYVKHSEVHPEDLALILAGRADELPMFQEAE